VFLAAECKMIAILLQRPGHQAEWLSWLSIAFAVFGFLFRPLIPTAVRALRSYMIGRRRRVTTTISFYPRNS
jgi:hypothetical protein